MPKGPRGEKRPADAIGAAVKLMRIAAGERETTVSAAAQLGKLGGRARARNLNAEQRTAIAKKAAAKRWSGNYGLLRIVPFAPICFRQNFLIYFKLLDQALNLSNANLAVYN